MAYNLVPFLLLIVFLVPIIADPDELQDFCVADTNASTVFMNGLPCLNPNQVSANHFTTSALGPPGNRLVPGTPGYVSSTTGFTVILTVSQSMPGINTLGLSMARTEVVVGGIVPPHTHPRATEMIYVVQGQLIAGFVDSANKHFSAHIKPGDVFVFPKGTMHYQQNVGSSSATLMVAFNSQNPGVYFAHQATFASNPAIPKEVLAKSFQITTEEVDKIRKGLGAT